MAKRLVDLDPRFKGIKGSPYQMLRFQCPRCSNGHYVGVFTHTEQAKWNDGTEDHYVWKVENKDDFNLLSLSPSVDCTKDKNGNQLPDDGKNCMWHGWVQNGNVT
jgi:hypothetical protein